jgi:hypothetical protein
VHAKIKLTRCEPKAREVRYLTGSLSVPHLKISPVESVHDEPAVSTPADQRREHRRMIAKLVRREVKAHALIVPRWAATMIGPSTVHTMPFLPVPPVNPLL